MHRSVTSIDAKIRWIEKRWEDDNKWLNESGLFAAYQIGGVDENIRASFDKLCPTYDRVSPVFRNISSDEEVEIEDESDDDTDWEQCSRKMAEKKVRAAAEKKVCIEDDERHHRQELFECELGAKRLQAQVDIVYARVLGRQKLLDGGVPEEEVDRVMPAPAAGGCCSSG
ncbi:hypothetical protein PHYPSEUDO_009923 [Phytophthora pseudosyringae]|uniref:Uncharacterized protein n=1 Tax=Phytophthora pseudosyringae TaxID=221518 RepID=A0A8T1VEM1_9STRA|nr:hypothetical protein PHYPSEUDO_009923 [Phytophthora pseudosyringae]